MNRRDAANTARRDYLLTLTVGELRAFVQGALSIRESTPAPLVRELADIATRLERVPTNGPGRAFARTGVLSGPLPNRGPL